MQYVRRLPTCYESMLIDRPAFRLDLEREERDFNDNKTQSSDFPNLIQSLQPCCSFDG